MEAALLEPALDIFSSDSLQVSAMLHCCQNEQRLRGPNDWWMRGPCPGSGIEKYKKLKNESECSLQKVKGVLLTITINININKFNNHGHLC